MDKSGLTVSDGFKSLPLVKECLHRRAQILRGALYLGASAGRALLDLGDQRIERQ